MESRKGRRTIDTLQNSPLQDKMATNCFPLSFNQKSIWLHHVLEPASAAYNVAQAIHFTNEINLSVFECALKKAIDRHPALRTTFAVHQGQPVQVIHEHLAAHRNIDASRWDDATLTERLKKELYLPFDLETGPLLRTFLFSRAAGDHVFLLTMHHIITDMWSIALFLKDFATIYQNELSANPKPLPKSRISFFDYVNNQENLLTGPRGAQLRAFWNQQLYGELPVLNLPTDRPRHEATTHHGAAHTETLGPALTRALKEIAKANKTTLFCVVLAAFKVLLHRYSGQDDILVGTPKAGRNFGTARLVGYFVNPVVLRSNSGNNPSFNRFLQQIHQTVKDAFAHDDYPFQKLIEDLPQTRDLRHSPIFQVAFSWQKSITVGNKHTMTSGAIGHSGSEIQFKGFIAKPLPLERPSPLDMTLLAGEIGDELGITFEYKQDLFEAATIARMAGHFQTLLAGIVARPDTPIDKLPLLTQEEISQLADWNNTAVPYPAFKKVHQLFEEKAAHTPEATAVVFGDDQLTYAELNQRANQLAHYLRKMGIGPDTFVGLFLQRSPEMIISLLGVLKCGGAYLPLDPDYPQERLAFMLADVKPQLLITQQSLRTRLPVEQAKHKPQILCLDHDQKFLTQQSKLNPDLQLSPDNPAYIIYTSGSTGKPKGVLVSHRPLVNYTLAAIDRFELSHRDRVLQFASFSFDTSAEEILPCLASGAALILRPDAMLDDIQTFVKSCAKLRLTVVDLPTSYWHELTAVLTKIKSLLPPSLRLVIIGGEAASPESVRIWQKQIGRRIRLLNTYGVTEACIISTIHDLTHAPVSPFARVPIGRPIQNVQTYILDKHRQPLPVGITGELFIGGVGLAQGYLNRPQITAEKFVTADTTIGDDRTNKDGGASPTGISLLSYPLYQTGDLARFLPDGSIEYIGRINAQIKIRGFRVEPGEVESALEQHPEIRAAAVTAQAEPAGHKRLVAYLVPFTETPPSTAELRQFLQQKLPQYMVPSVFVLLPELPLSPNGKVNRTALPLIEKPAVDPTKTRTVPQTPLEKHLASVWANVLHLEHVGLHENFFELGGHSLLAMQIISRIRETVQVDLSMRALFEAPTVAEIARRITALKTNTTPLSLTPMAPAARPSTLPLSFSQERIWFLCQLNPHSAAYNIPVAVCLEGSLDTEALAWSINQLIRRHESLRTRFTAVNGQPTAIIEPAYDFRLPFEDLTTFPEAQRRTVANNRMEAIARTPFDLNQLPLFQLRLFQLDKEKYFLLINIHHIISDQWSLGVLGHELAAYYRAYQSGQPADLPELPIQSIDHAIWQRQLAEGASFEAQMNFWKQQLADIATLDLPTDRPRPAINTSNGAIITSPLPVQLDGPVQSLSKQENVTPYMILLAAFKVLLSRYTSLEDIVVGSPIANRHHLPSESIISTLVNTFVLRTDLSGNLSFRQLIQRVQKVALDAYAHQDIPFEKLVEALQLERETSRSPLFQIFFNVQNAPFSLPDLPGVESEVIEIDRGAAQFDLSLSIDTAVTRRATLEYNTDLFDADRMERLLAHYWTLLEAAVTHPDSPIADLPLLTEAEIAQFDTWNRATTSYPDESCLHHLFEAQVEETPGKTAVTFEGQSLTYRQLNEKANQLARHLQTHNIGPGSLVAIKLERSLEMIVALLAILKTGAAYIPLDPAFPRERLQFMLADSQTRILVTQSGLLAASGAATNVRYVCLDLDAAVINQYDNHNVSASVTSTDLAYVIYTSGSSGMPKGVQIEHRSVVNFLKSMSAKPGLSADDVLLAVTTLSFDIAVLEIFLPLINGARIELASRETAVNAHKLRHILTQSGITIMQATPTTWRMLLEAGWSGNTQLKILCGGEAMPPDLASQLLPRCDQLWNMYGPTETTVWSSVYRVLDGEAPILIGRPIDNTTFYILDSRQRPLPVGIPGELFIGGHGLSRGYLSRPALTAEKFIPNPFSDDGTEAMAESRGKTIHTPLLYRTGDLARFLPDGNVAFLGRKDSQIKLRGFRIEPGEIEAVLADHPGVREVVVTLRKISDSDQRLVAYFTPESTAPAAEDLHAVACTLLPEYMVPSAFVAVDSFPLTPNNKIDRSALPAPQAFESRTTTKFAAPQNELEIQLQRIWENVLGISGIGRHDNFFELGGHSLLAVRLFSHVRKLVQIDLPLTTLFRAPTIAQLAQALSQEGIQTKWTSLVPVQPNGSRPIFFHVAPFLISVLSFSELAHYLGDDQPFFALQPQGVEGDEPYHQRVEDMAAHYIQEIRSLQPEGPYMLGGHCAGSWVAFEMAQQLQAQGEEVGMLVLVDSEPPNIAPPQINRLKYIISRISYYCKEGRFWNAFIWKLGLAYQHLVILRTGNKDARRLAAVRKAHATAHQQYRSGSFDGDILLLRSRESITLRDKDWHLRWSELITGRLKHDEVPGTHATLLVEPNVKAMAAKIREAIDAAMAQNDV